MKTRVILAVLICASILCGAVFVPGVRYKDTIIQFKEMWPAVIREDRLTGHYFVTIPGSKGWKRFEDVPISDSKEPATKWMPPPEDRIPDGN